jgi:plastocyanin
MKRLILGLGIAALAVVTAACSGATAAPASDGPVATAASGDAIAIVAKDIAFQTTAVTVAAGEPVAIVLDNQDGAPHNIAIKDTSGAEVFKGEIVSSAKVTNQVPALAAGAYTFFCEVHPDMTGTITAQ